MGRAKSRRQTAGRGRYVFFIGGSGARAYRAFLHSCAAGVIKEDEVRVMLLDADTKNAACTECEELHQLYNAQHEMFQKMYRERRRRPVSTPAFHCKVTMYHGKAVSPVETNKRRLLQLVPGYHQDGRRALKWFYDKTEREQDLLNGFYAHPNIGCLFFQDLSDGSNLGLRHTNELFKGCLSDIENDLRNGDVQIVIVGSLFGGTGAAGIPTVLKMVKEYCRDHGGDVSRLHFGGVLFTPYFKVPTKQGSDSNIAIDSDTFLSTTRAALFYYQFQDVFQQIYLVGKEEPDLICPEYEDGGTGQKDKAHIVELLSVAAIKDFLGNGPLSQDPRERISVLMLQSPKETGEDLDLKDRVDWNSECIGRDFWALADMLRTQMLLETDIYPYAEAKEDGERSMYQWYKVYEIHRYDLDDYEDDLTRMRRYTEDFLEWMYDLQHRYIKDGDEGMERDPGIALSGSALEQMMELIEERLEVQKQKGEVRNIRASMERVATNFNNAVELAQNIGYVTDKAFEILSLLGVASKSVTAFRLAGLFKQLFDLSSEKREPK